MKKLLLLLLFIPVTLSAQYGTGAVKLGYFNPDATDGGFIIGYEAGKAIDERLDIGLSVDWFHKSYIDKDLVSQFDDIFGNIEGSINELRAETNLHSFPVMGTMTAYFPAAPRVTGYVTGGIGMEVLLIFYKNFQNPDDDEFHGAFDIAWRLGGGMMYQLGSHSDLLLELTYHSSKPSWQYDVEDEGVKRTFERTFDMSGFAIRGGVRFYF